jgi:hypothetical protein
MYSRALTVIVVVATALSLGAQQDRGGTGNPAQPPPARQGALDQLLAPIALYPDALVAQILMCVQKPSEVRQVSAWLKQNPDLKGSALQEAAQKQGFDSSFVAMVLFPQVLDRMAGDIDWTTLLGQAFSSDKNAVFDSIQRLRAEAQAEGNLKSTPQQQVQTETTSSGQQVIVIQPANPQVIYVPQYDPQVVYVQAEPQGDAAAAGVIGFTAGVIVGAAAADNCWGWHGGCCYGEGWNNYYQSRENMANDRYNDREDAANQRYDDRESAATQRSDDVSERQTDRQTDRQDAQGDRQQAQGDRQTAQGDRQLAQTERQQGASGREGSRQESWGGGSEARGRSEGTSQWSGDRSGTRSGAFSGYQGGASERSASSRGRSSMSSARGGGYRGGRR